MRVPSIVFGGIAACALVAGACGGSGDDESSASPGAGGASPAASSTAAPSPGSADGLELVNGLPACLPPGTEVAGSAFEPVANPVTSTPPEQRRTIGVEAVAADLYVGKNNLAIGIQDETTGQPIGNARVRMTLYKLGANNSQEPVCQVEGMPSAPGVGPETQHIHGEGEIHIHGGEDENRSVHYAHVEFDQAGNWGLFVEAILQDGSRKYGDLLLQVGGEPFTPAPGDDAIKSDNLTRDDVDDIREIDSGDPPNDMHDHKIREVIEAGRPLVIVFSTPAYCTSAFCGPVNQEVEDLYEEYKDRVDFVHIEIWRDRSAGTLNPTAREWLMRPDGGLSEPVVYVVGKDGVIFDRWDGPVARNIMHTSVAAVAGGATYQD